MKNILIFPCGSEVGLEIYRSLEYSKEFDIYGGSSIDDHGKFIYKNYIPNIPFVSNDDFITVLNKVIKKYKIDFIFPAHDSVVLKLAQEKEKKNLNCDVITSQLNTCEITRSKLKTYKFFKSIILTPKIFKNINEVGSTDFPIFLKPDIGQGSKGTFIVKNAKEAEFYLEKDKTLVFMEFLPGKEYTVDCFTNRKGVLLLSEGRERKRILNGISVNSSAANDARFTDIANKINAALSFSGAWFFQVKENFEGKLTLMEIAPRIAGTMGLIRCKGANLVLLSLFDALGCDVDVLMNKYDLIIDRALHNSYKHNIKYDHVYMDLDDFIIFKNKINPTVMAFIYQCINNGIKMHLITKHRDNLNLTFEKYRLKNVFDDLILLKENNEKHLYIKEKKSIFLDDSFSERKNVSENCNIPVFDFQMIECLME